MRTLVRDSHSDPAVSSVFRTCYCYMRAHCVELTTCMNLTVIALRTVRSLNTPLSAPDQEIQSRLGHASAWLRRETASVYDVTQPLSPPSPPLRLLSPLSKDGPAAVTSTEHKVNPLVQSLVSWLGTSHTKESCRAVTLFQHPPTPRPLLAQLSASSH